jgi:hypothetical protein
MAESSTALRTYCSALYNLFDQEAVDVESDGSVYRVYKGFIVASASSVGIPDGVYRRVMERLTALQCLEVIGTGRRNVPSVIVLRRPPTPEIWDTISEKDLTKPPSDAKMMEQEIKSLQSRLGGIDQVAAFTTIDSELTSIKLRLDAIEASLAKMDSRSSD